VSGRLAAGSLAAAALSTAWLGPRFAPDGFAFTTHMTAHMLVVAVAAPLLALGLAGSRLDPVRRWPRLAAPIQASLVDLGVVSLWHAPALHEAARHRAEAYAAEQLSFLAAGLWLWCALLGGEPGARLARAGTGVVALLLTFAHMTLIGALLSLTPRPLYHHGAAGGAPLADQQLGGTIMLVFGGCYVAAGLWLTVLLLRGVRPLPAGR
jgi:putative membrane protein